MTYITIGIEEKSQDVSGTFSIVAVDPATSVSGAAVASKFPAVGKVVPYVRADVGAFCTQHYHNPEWGPIALDLLAAGNTPEQVLGELLRDDPYRDKRQISIIDIKGRTANINPAGANPSGNWWGSMLGRFYACQGNSLVNREVIISMAGAYEEKKGSLADRLIAALVAADQAGGDRRGRFSAGIRIVRQGFQGSCLELDVDESDDAVFELSSLYNSLKY